MLLRTRRLSCLGIAVETAKNSRNRSVMAQWQYSFSCPHLDTGALGDMGIEIEKKKSAD
tara:strand:- start:2432 stop:2608 length:177 start_codon:yes stop_codon:yes gene_type:complete